MSVESSLSRAKEAAARLPYTPGDVSELLRADAVTFCGKLPDPPVYRRQDDPARELARALISEGESLLARAYQSQDDRWTAALEAYLTMLHHIADGRVELAEASWVEAQRLEQLATGRRRLFALSDERRAPVFDPVTRESRFDPRPERSMTVKVPCPACRKVSEVSVSPSLADHQFRCPLCGAAWHGYFAQVRSVEVTRRGQRRRYDFRLRELGGTHTRLEVEDGSVGELQVARHDLLAFLYLPRTHLRGVLNLNSSRVLWVTGGGPCFVATVAFGEEARELEVLRGFRDRVLLPSAPGRHFVAAYYAHGPAMARAVVARPWLRRLTRRALAHLVAALEQEAR